MTATPSSKGSYDLIFGAISYATPPQASLYTLARHRIAGFHRACRKRYGPLNSLNIHPTTKSNLLNGSEPF